VATHDPHDPHDPHGHHGGPGIALPAPTVWPMVLALGVTLIAAGLVTHPTVGALGLVIGIVAGVGWFREVLPHDRHEIVPVVELTPEVAPARHGVRHLRAGVATHRLRLPVEIYPYSSGLKAGVAGGAAMAAVAGLFGVISHGSVWYPLNLLAAAGSMALTRASEAELMAFNATGFVLGLVIHGLLSILVGVVYAVLLPIFPRRPIVFGGVVVPLLMTGFAWSVLEVVNPLLNERIDWKWFVASQIAFGLVAGLVVSRTHRIPTMQHLPLAVRAGVEATGLVSGHDEERRGR
jgi:hypothetical protein